ncbi:MAG TPA: hypothetical protein VMV05_02770 [bacterium]|nr:hypothetical protein [bacterium]
MRKKKTPEKIEKYLKDLIFESYIPPLTQKVSLGSMVCFYFFIVGIGTLFASTLGIFENLLKPCFQAYPPFILPIRILLFALDSSFWFWIGYVLAKRIWKWEGFKLSYWKFLTFTVSAMTAIFISILSIIETDKLLKPLINLESTNFLHFVAYLVLYAEFFFWVWLYYRAWTIICERINPGR